jgi:hypothetical protein
MQLTDIVRGACLWALFMSGAAAAASQTYVYAVEHPTYGNIGSYTETIDTERDVTRIDSELRVAVKVIGIVVHREQASATELWRGTRLASMQTVTEINGARTEVSGAMNRDAFVVTSASGTRTAPAEVAPSDPWMLTGIGHGVIVSTRSGKVECVNVTGGEAAALTVEGMRLATRHFQVDSPSQADRFDIWLDGNGVPVRFRSREKSGDLINFVLVSPDPQADAAPGPRGFAAPRTAPGAG